MATAFVCPPNHLLTAEEWQALDPDTYRHAELVEGVVVVVPPMSPMHQHVAARLANSLNEQLPPEWVAIGGVEVVLTARFPATYRAPDTIIIPTSLIERPGPVAAADVLLVAEVVSPGTRGLDRITKPAEYATAGIPHYWRIELDPAEMFAYERSGRPAYGDPVTAGPVVDAALDGMQMRVDVAALMRR